jgi:hypothetical protein
MNFRLICGGLWVKVEKLTVFSEINSDMLKEANCTPS